MTVSGALQALAGHALGTAPIQYGVFTAGTGFAQPNGLGTFWLVTPTLNYAANCKGNCTPGTRVVQGLTPSSAQIGIVAPGTEFTPRMNQLDFGLSKTFTVNTSRITPKLDIFNATNSDRLHRGREHAVRRDGLRPAVGDSAGPHCSGRRGCEVVREPVGARGERSPAR